MDNNVTHANRLDPPARAQSTQAVQAREDALIRRMRIARTLAVYSAVATSVDVAVSAGVTMAVPGRGTAAFFVTFLVVAVIAVVMGSVLLQRRFGR